MSKVAIALLGFALTGVAGASVHAADIYRKEGGGFKDGPIAVSPAIWSGFYLGVNGGYARKNDSTDITYTDAQFNGRSRGFQEEGGFGGGQIGYNIQRGSLVYGVEADIQGSDISDSFKDQAIDGFTQYDISARSSLDWFGTVRGRIGFAYGNALIYATGGFAYGSVDQKITVSNPVGLITVAQPARGSSSTATLTGYVVGGGVEYSISPAWSVKGEYQYIDLGSERLGDFDGQTSEIDNSFHTVRVGLNYHIHDHYVPLK